MSSTSTLIFDKDHNEFHGFPPSLKSIFDVAADITNAQCSIEYRYLSNEYIHVLLLNMRNRALYFNRPNKIQKSGFLSSNK